MLLRLRGAATRDGSLRGALVPVLVLAAEGGGCTELVSR